VCDSLPCVSHVCVLSQNGNIKKGPVGVGVRIQENMRIGPLKVEAVAAQVKTGGTEGGGQHGARGQDAILLGVGCGCGGGGGGGSGHLSHE